MQHKQISNNRAKVIVHRKILEDTFGGSRFCDLIKLYTDLVLFVI